MQLRYSRLGHLTLLLAFAGGPSPGYLALADSVPESIRIQQKAEKAYETAPVVPIDRQNAHRRDLSKDAPASGDQQVAPSLPRQDGNR